MESIWRNSCHDLPNLSADRKSSVSHETDRTYDIAEFIRQVCYQTWLRLALRPLEDI